MSQIPYDFDPMSRRRLGWKLLLYIWASPASLIGLALGLLGLLTGGKSQLRRGCLEFYGGAVTWLLRRNSPVGEGIMAMTLGHVIVGQHRRGLMAARDHEQVHVRQYERWGPLFVPVYLLLSLALWLKKKNMYRDNPFEVEAYALADPRDWKPTGDPGQDDR